MNVELGTENVNAVVQISLVFLKLMHLHLSISRVLLLVILSKLIFPLVNLPEFIQAELQLGFALVVCQELIDG